MFQPTTVAASASGRVFLSEVGAQPRNPPFCEETIAPMLPHAFSADSTVSRLKMPPVTRYSLGERIVARMTWLHPNPWIIAEMSPLVEVRQSVWSCFAMILYASVGLDGSMMIVSLGKTSATVSGLGSTWRE